MAVLRHAGPVRGVDLTVRVAGDAWLTFLDPPAPVRGYLETEIGNAHPTAASDAGAIIVRFARLPARRRSILRADGILAAADDDGRFFLLDRARREAQLPTEEDVTELVVDPDIDCSRHACFHMFLNRMIEWQAARRGFVPIKAAAVTVPEGTVAVAGLDGTGKTTTLAGLLTDATAYLTDERLLLGDGLVTALVTAPAFSLGRTARRTPHLGAGLPRWSRAAMRLVPAVIDRGPEPLRRRLEHALGERWVTVDLAAMRPSMQFPATAPLDLLAFLVPHEGEHVACDDLDEAEAVSLVRAHVRYLHDLHASPLRVLHQTFFPTAGTWTGSQLDRQLARASEVVRALRVVRIRAPERATAAELAGIVRSAAGTGRSGR